MPAERFRIIDLDAVNEHGVPDPVFYSDQSVTAIRICHMMRNQQGKNYVVIDSDDEVIEVDNRPPEALNRDSWAKGKHVANQPKEASIVAAILRFLLSLEHCEYEKRFGSVYQKGRPDITGAVIGIRFELEVKVADKEAEPLQLGFLIKWQNAGAIAGVVRSVDDVRELFTAYGIDWQKLQTVKALRVAKAQELEDVK